MAKNQNCVTIPFGILVFILICIFMLNKKVEMFEGHPVVWDNIEKTSMYIVKYLGEDGNGNKFIKHNDEDEDGNIIVNSTLFFEAIRDNNTDYEQYLTTENAAQISGQTLKSGFITIEENEEDYGSLQEVLDLFEIQKVT